MQGVLGPQLVVQGRLEGKADVTIEGRFDGEIELDGALALGREAVVVAPVRAKSVEVEGELHGDVTAEAVAVRPEGWVEGNVRARRIVIDDGAALDGEIEMEFDDVRRAGKRS